MLSEEWSKVLLPTVARQIQSLLSISCALYEGVLLLLLSCLRAFYDCTSIVETLFYNESYFRIFAVVH